MLEREIVERTTVNAFYHRPGSYLAFRDTTNTCRALVVHILIKDGLTILSSPITPKAHLCLNTTHTTKLFISCLLPLCNETIRSIQHRGLCNLPREHLLLVSVTLIKQPIIQLSRNGLSLVIEFVYVAWPSVRYSHYRPEAFSLALSFLSLIL